MAALELEGKITVKLPVQSGQGARGSWEKQEFVLEYPDGNYNASAFFTSWGSDKVSELAKYQVGDAVRVFFNVKGREYNGRWYNDLRVWKLAPAGAASGAPAPAQGGYAAPSYGPAPAPSYGPAPDTGAPAPTLEDLPVDSIGDDDLPF